MRVIVSSILFVAGVMWLLAMTLSLAVGDFTFLIHGAMAFACLFTAVLFTLRRM